MKPYLTKALIGNKIFNVIEINETKITLLDESKSDSRNVVEITEVRLYVKCTRKKKRTRTKNELKEKTEIDILNANISKLIREFKNKK